MTEGINHSKTSPTESEATRRWKDLVVPAVWTGLTLALAGVAIGLAIAFEREEVVCADGTYFPEGTADHTCYAHPQLLGGTAVALIAAMLGILIVLSGVIAKRVLVDRPLEASDPGT